MKTSVILILCLAIAAQQATAKHSIREDIHKAAHDAKEVVKDVAHVGSHLKDAAKVIRELVHDAQSKIHKRSTEEKGTQQETESSKVPLTKEKKQQEIIDLWADKAKNKLSNSSEEVQIKGQEIIEHLANKQSEELKKCSEKTHDHKHEEHSKTAPAELPVHNIRSALKDLKKHVCVAVTMRKFSLESKWVDRIIAKMVADDKKKTDEKHVEGASA